MTFSFVSSDGEEDSYSVDIDIPGEPDRTVEVSYGGKEVIIHQNDELVMLIRPRQARG